MKTFFKIFCLLLSLLSVHQLKSQNFTKVDENSKSAPFAATRSVEKLAEYLNKNTRDDLEKVRAYYIWLTHNVEYDTKTFFSDNPNPKTTAADALKYKKAICQGYSELFKALCDYSNIPCFLVSGYSKGYGYKPGKTLSNSDHAWNTVYINNSWHLIDATWGGGYIDEKQRYVKQFSEEYFMSKPEVFILKHLPSDPIWQLLPCPINIDDYQKSDSEIIKLTKNCTGNFNFSDSISAYQKLSPIQQQMAAAERAFRFNPENVEAPGYALLSLSYDMGNELKIMYDEKNYKRALEINYTISELNEKALSYLRKSKTSHAKNAVEICKQNIESSKGNIKSLEKALK